MKKKRKMPPMGINDASQPDSATIRLTSSLLASHCKQRIGVSDERPALTLMSSRFREFRYWRFLFHRMGGRLSPMMPQVSTALWPTVTVVTLSFWSSGRDSMYTSVGAVGGEIKKKKRSRH